MDVTSGSSPSKNKIQLKRRNRIIFGTVLLITALAVIWPGHAIFSSATPLIFGFPLSFAWIIFWVIVGFAAMMGLYLSDSHDDDVNKDTI
ncbi:hypothetical protein BH23BAC3_BH23BAC3_23600 [soil metagenome]